MAAAKIRASIQQASSPAPTPVLDVSPLKSVQIESLALLKIIKHSSQQSPSISTGALVGMDVDGVLEITNSFPFLSGDANGEGHSDAAASAPRAKFNVPYQNEMMRFLRDVNGDANNVGWYTSTSMGNFINSTTIENQFFYQKELNERTVALVHDVSRSALGTLSLRAFRLSPAFMAAHREGKFTIESIKKNDLKTSDIFVELPVKVHNSHFVTSLLHRLPAPPPTEELAFPHSLASLEANLPKMPLAPNPNSLDVTIDPLLEKTSDLLLEAIEAHQSELNNHQYYQRSLQREQNKITAWQTKRKGENAARVAAKQSPLPEDEWQRLFKLPAEPSRLEMLLNARQVEQYARQVDGFAATITAKMFAVKDNLVPDRE